jgi:hypothetical protein
MWLSGPGKAGEAMMAAAAARTERGACREMVIEQRHTQVVGCALQRATQLDNSSRACSSTSSGCMGVVAGERRGCEPAQVSQLIARSTAYRTADRGCHCCAA